MQLRTVMAIVVLAAAMAVGSMVAPRVRRERQLVSPATRDAVTRQIEREVRDAYDLSKPGVEARLLALYPDSGRVVSAGGGEVITGRDSVAMGIRSFWENVGRNMRDPAWIWDRMYVDVLSPNAAVLTATYHVPHHTPRGEPHVIAGAWTAAFVRENGRWVIVQEHLSDLPQMPTPPAGAAHDSMPGMKM